MEMAVDEGREERKDEKTSDISLTSRSPGGYFQA